MNRKRKKRKGKKEQQKREAKKEEREVQPYFPAQPCLERGTYTDRSARWRFIGREAVREKKSNGKAARSRITNSYVYPFVSLFFSFSVSLPLYFPTWSKHWAPLHIELRDAPLFWLIASMFHLVLCTCSVCKANTSDIRHQRQKKHTYGCMLRRLYLTVSSSLLFLHVSGSVHAWEPPFQDEQISFGFPFSRKLQSNPSEHRCSLSGHRQVG